MATFVRFNQRTGRYEEVDDQSGNVVREVPQEEIDRAAAPTTPVRDAPVVTEQNSRAFETLVSDDRGGLAPADTSSPWAVSPEQEDEDGETMRPTVNESVERPDSSDGIHVGLQGGPGRSHLGADLIPPDTDQMLASPGMDASANPHGTEIPRIPLANNQIFPRQSPEAQTQGEALTNTLLFGDSSAPTWGDVPFSADWFRNMGTNVANVGIDAYNWWNRPRANSGRQQQQTREGGTPSLADIGNTATTPQLPSEVQLRPEDQRLIERLTAISEGFGANTQAPRAPQLPAAPVMQEDAGAQLLADRARERDTEMDTYIQEQRAEIQQRREVAQNKWTIMGRFFSEWGASGRLSQAGMAMSRALEANQDMVAELRAEENALMSLGMQSEDAAIQAQANLLSGRSMVANQNATMAYNRDVAQAGLDSDYQMAAWQGSQRTAAAQADIATTIAQIERDAIGRGRTEQNAAYSTLVDVPEYTRSAWNAIGESAGLHDEGARTAFTNQRMRERSESGLMAYIGANAGNGNNREFLATMRRFDPSISQRDIRTLTPTQLYMRAINGPGANTELRNPQYSRYARFAAAPTE